MTENIEEFLKDLEDLIANLSETQNLYQDYTPQHVFVRKIDATIDPIMIVFSSDIHFGSIYTDYKAMLKIWNTILENDNIYLAVVGDFVDNFDTNSIKLLQAGINSQLITPMLQRDIFIRYIRTLEEKGKLLACVLGNHENFSNQYPYFQLIKNTPVASNRLFLKLKLFTIEYKIAMVHKSRYNSSINPIHSCYRELTVFYPDADIIVTSHTHLPAMAVFPYPYDGGYRNRVLIKTGTLKTLDPYSLAHFSHPIDSEISTPCVVLHPLVRSMVPFSKIEDGLTYLRNLR